MERIDLIKIISEIAPLYNSYKQNNRSINGTDALEIMWEIGDILKNTIQESGLAPHSLYRKIYGKSEGSTNIIQNSYITREFLGRAYRIRNIFNEKKEIREKLPKLKNFILFRESMPFFDNKKYILTGKEMDQLLELLNSSKNQKIILFEIKNLQIKKIGIKNPRDQKLKELKREKQIFIDFYNYLYKVVSESDYVSIKENINKIDRDTLLKLSEITSCLAQEGLKFPEFSSNDVDKDWIQFVQLLQLFSSQKDPKLRRRFRRLIPPERIVRLAEMIQAVSSEEDFNVFKNSSRS